MRGPFVFMTVNAESIPGTEWSLPFAHVVAGAAGDRSACVLERGTGTPEPRRAALITDDGVLELTIDAPVWDADIVFDGTKYQVLWIDTDTLHNISIDEDGVIGDDPTSALFDG